MPDHNIKITSYSEIDIHEVIRRIKSGEQLAFKSLFFAWQHRIYRYIWLRVRNIEIAEDIVQDVFFRIWQKRETLQENGNFTAFIFQIAHNLVVDWARKNGAKLRMQGTLTSNEKQSTHANEQAELHDLESIISNAIETLPPAMQQAFVLHRFENLNYKQIAEIMGISNKTVEKHMSAALKKLRGVLRDSGFP